MNTKKIGLEFFEPQIENVTESYCITRDDKDIKIYYQIFKRKIRLPLEQIQSSNIQNPESSEPIRLFMIQGFAAAWDSWLPQIWYFMGHQEQKWQKNMINIQSSNELGNTNHQELGSNSQNQAEASCTQIQNNQSINSKSQQQSTDEQFQNQQDVNGQDTQRFVGQDSSEAAPTQDGDQMWKHGSEQKYVDRYIEICALDNRGVGLSSKPQTLSAYGTDIMAKDCLSVLEDLKWIQKKIHVMGFSMGGLVSLKLAASIPQCVDTLTVVGVGDGFWGFFPKLINIPKYYSVLTANTVHKRVKADLGVHFTPSFLDKKVKYSSKELQVFSVLEQEYLLAIQQKLERSEDDYVHEEKRKNYEQKSNEAGQAYAVFWHKLSNTELENLKQLKIMFIHGDQDIVANPASSFKLALKLNAVQRNHYFVLEGAHFINREKADQVNHLLHNFILNQDIHKDLDHVGDTLYVKNLYDHGHEQPLKLEHVITKKNEVKGENQSKL